MDMWNHLDRSMKIKRWKLSDTYFSRTTCQNLGTSSSIKRMRLNEDDSRTDVQSEPLIKGEETHPTLAPNLSINWDVLWQKNLFSDVSSKSNYLENLVLEYLVFYSFYTHFHVWGVFEIKIWWNESKEITSWTPKLIFEIAGWKTLNRATN